MKKIIYIFIFIFIFIFNLICTDFTLDEDGDSKNDRWINVELYKDWKKLDVNKNDKPDESCFYTSDTNKIYFIINEKYDYSGNGKPDIWIKNEKKGKFFFTEIKADTNGNGKIDLAVHKKNDIIYLKKIDNDDSGKFDVEEKYDENGEMLREGVDTNKDGKVDDFYYYDGEILLKEEIDTNYDEKPDLWVLFEYGTNNSFKGCVIEKDNNFDGKPDEWHYSDEKRRIIRKEKDLNFDGKVDEIKNFKK